MALTSLTSLNSLTSPFAKVELLFDLKVSLVGSYDVNATSIHITVCGIFEKLSFLKNQLP